MTRKFKSEPIDPSEITPEETYLSRRDVLKAMGIVTASAALLAACGPNLPETGGNAASPGMRTWYSPTTPTRTAIRSIPTTRSSTTTTITSSPPTSRALPAGRRL